MANFAPPQIVTLAVDQKEAGLLLMLYHCAPVLYYLCTGILLGSVGYCLVLYLAPKSRVNGNGKAVFITGCDSGFGFGLAKRLDSLGFTVFAGCLLADSGGEGSKKLRAECSSRLSTVQIDVTDDGQVKAAVQQVKNSLPTESEGRVVNVTSAEGLHSTPTVSAYCMTKAALESFSDALRHEMHKWGVKVIIVEPGSFGPATNIALPGVYQNLRNNIEEVVKEDYGMEYFDFKTAELRTLDDEGATDPSPVIDALADAVTLTSPSHRYLVGSSFEDYVTWMWLGHFPTRWTDSTKGNDKEGDPKPAMLPKTN
ncbi:hypothetical protein Bbelb_085080 [Branchiostoma belcheri]|nr:hypothetical protein Bbelb_085080 [Branchiostoma belcheri]